MWCGNVPADMTLEDLTRQLSLFKIMPYRAKMGVRRVGEASPLDLLSHMCHQIFLSSSDRSPSYVCVHLSIEASWAILTFATPEYANECLQTKVTFWNKREALLRPTVWPTDEHVVHL